MADAVLIAKGTAAIEEAELMTNQSSAQPSMSDLMEYRTLPTLGGRFSYRWRGGSRHIRASECIGSCGGLV
jgi:hypothetical protein